MRSPSSIWGRVRSWLRWSLAREHPRPLPVLLEDVYAPASRLAYHTMRQWETSLVERHDLWHAELIYEAQQLGRALRRYLLLVQRLRHLASAGGDDTGARVDAIREVWARYSLGWESDVLVTLEELVDASRTTQRSGQPSGEELAPRVVRLRTELDERVRAIRAFLAAQGRERDDTHWGDKPL